MSWAELTFDPRPLIANYLAGGGLVQIIPCGVSGYRSSPKVFVSGRRGWIRKYGIAFVPAAARVPLAEGRITIAEARVGIVYNALLRSSSEAVARQKITLTDLGRALGFYPHQVKAVVDVLERDGFVQREARALIAVPRSVNPHWTNYVRAA